MDLWTMEERVRRPGDLLDEVLKAGEVHESWDARGVLKSDKKFIRAESY